MELLDLLARRRMVRSFDGTPVDLDWLDELCTRALWAPTAGNTAGVRMYTLGASGVATYIEIATDPTWRATSRRADGLARAGGVVLVTSRPQDYLARYGEPDKAASGLAEEAAWTVSYWHADAAMATMALLLLIEEAGWQATIWGNFRHENDVLDWIDARDERLLCAVLLGRGDGLDVSSTSLARETPTRASRVRRVRT